MHEKQFQHLLFFLLKDRISFCNWFFIIWVISGLAFISIIWCRFSILCDLFGSLVLPIKRDRPIQPSKDNRLFPRIPHPRPTKGGVL